MFCFGLSKDLQTSLLPMMVEGLRVSKVPGFHMSGCPVVGVSGCPDVGNFSIFSKMALLNQCMKIEIFFGQNLSFESL